MVWAKKWSAAAGVAVVMLSTVGCGSDVERTISTSTPGGLIQGCSQAAISSGRLVVGTPAPQIGVVDPATKSVEVPVPPVLRAIDIERASQTADVVSYSFTGDGVVGWSARFVEDANLRGTNQSVSVGGRCVLQLDLSGVASDESPTPPSQTPQRLTTPAAGQVVEVLRFSSSEGTAQSFIGTRSQQPSVTVDAVDEPTPRLRITVSNSKTG